MPAQAVGGSGGAAPDDSYRFTAKIEVGGVRACSGALVAPQWIVTAAACFAEDGKPPASGAPSRTATVSVGHGTTAAKTATITTLVPHADRNAVLAKLNTRITGIDPVAISTTAPATGETVRAAGYGRTAKEWVPDKLHTASFEVKTVRDGALDLTRQDADAGICKGDAGGPLLRESEGRVELTAIHHTAKQKGCLRSPDTGQETVETRLDDLGEWIEQNTVDALRSSVRFGKVTGIAGKCLDINNSNTADGTQVQLTSCNGNAAQEVTVPGDGTMRVFGKCIDSFGPAASASGDRFLQLWSCNNSDAQKWEHRPNGVIYQPGTDRCIDAPNSNNGARLYIYACHGRDNQQWTVPAFSGARFGKVTSVNSKCLDINNSNTADGTQVQLTSCNGNAAQEVTVPGDGTVRVFGKCIDSFGPKINNAGVEYFVQLWSCNGSPAQKWRLRPDTTLYNERIQSTETCLDTAGTDNGARLYIHPCNGGPNQQWKLP